MFWRFVVIIAVISILVLAGISCNQDPLINTAYGGAILLTAPAVNENMEIDIPETTFKANENFYFYFNNNGPFNVDRIEVQLINSKTGKVLAETDYSVDPQSDVVTDMIFFSGPGRFKITVVVNAEVRAIREVIVE